MNKKSTRLLAVVRDLESRNRPPEEVDAAYDEYCKAVDAEKEEMRQYVEWVHSTLAEEAAAKLR